KNAGGVPACDRRCANRSEEIAQLFSRLEANGVSGRDLHFDAGLRIAPDPFLALFHLKDAEATELDTLSARERITQTFDDRIDGLCRFDARNFRHLRDLVDDVRLDHGTSVTANYISFIWNDIGSTIGSSTSACSNTAATRPRRAAEAR